MIKYFGVAAEFNPFHDGHAYLISKAKETTGCDCCVAAMSGDFTQRGEPAVFDKWERAKIAVEHGVDLVIEIPQILACSSAQYFAKGAVSVLAGLGICSHLVFGSECGSTGDLIDSANFISEHAEEIDSMASELVRKGISYPKAREQAAKEICEYDTSYGEQNSSMSADELSTVLAQPNDILALEYLRQDLGSMEPIAVKRIGKGHLETASLIRQKMLEKNREGFARREERYLEMLEYRIAVTSADDLESYAESPNGLGMKLKKEFRYAGSLEELVGRIKSKAYTRTAVMRLFTHILLDMKRTDVVSASSSYARVLAMNDAGAEALRTARKAGLLTIPVISNLNKDMDKLNDLQKRMISFDIMAGDVYNIITGSNLYANSDHVRSPFKA